MEKDFVANFIKLAPKDWHVQKIESNTSSGIPDLTVAMPQKGGQGREFWIEVKNGKGAEIRPFQIAWWHKRIMAGGRIWLLWNTGNEKNEWVLWLVTKQMLEMFVRAPKIPSLSALTVTPLDGVHRGTNLASLYTTLRYYN